MLSLLIAFTLAAPPGPAKEPAYRGTPRYLALSFAADGADRVWLALDGDTLHVDRNENGDLTDPGEAVGKRADGTFHVSSLVGGDRTHRRLTVRVVPLEEYAEERTARRPDVKAALARDPAALVATVTIDVDRPGLTGTGEGDRPRFLAGPFDLAGPLVVAATPAAAPVVRFGGPLEVTCFAERPAFASGEWTEVPLVVGSPGVGPGTLAMLVLDGTLPRDHGAWFEVAFGWPGGESRQGGHAARHGPGCLTGAVHLWKPVPGPATLTVGVRNWPAATTSHPVTILPLAAPPEAVAAELLASLPHPATTGGVTQVAFSPDGTRLLAAGYPSGVIQLWDVATRKERWTAETGRREAGALRYALPTADWATLYAVVTRQKNTVKEVEPGHWRTTRLDYAGELLAFDLATGRAKTPLPSPADAAPTSGELSPDGREILAAEVHSLDDPDLCGQNFRGATVLTDRVTGVRRAVWPLSRFAAFADGGRSVVLQPWCTPAAKWSRLVRIDAATGATLAERETTAGDGLLTPAAVSPAGDVLVALADATQGTSPDVRFLDALTFADRGRLTATDRPPCYGWGQGVFSPDGRRYALLDGAGGVRVWDVAAMRAGPVRSLGTTERPRTAAFSPDGRTLAVAWCPQVDDNDRTVTPLAELPHARVVLFDATGERPPRTLIAPRGVPAAVAFSPDGRTLALGSTGGVHLFAVR